MPASGRHRRSAPRDHRLTRLFMAAGTGSAALALPLLTATNASAAAAAKSAPVKSAPDGSAPQAAAKPAARTYDVVRGDSLSAIARTHHVVGGWHRLYTANRPVIGADPDLIRPGEHLTLGRGGAAHPLTRAAPTPAHKARPPPAGPLPSAPPPSAPATRSPAPTGPAATTPASTSW